PLQKPYPRVWIPGVLSKETIIWAAKQRYPYIALNTSIEATKNIWKIYDQVAEETGYSAGPENRGYLQQVHVSDSEEKAEKNARPVLVDAGRVHRSRASGMVGPIGLFLARASPPVCRIRGRAGGEPARASDLRKAGRRWAGYLRNA